VSAADPCGLHEWDRVACEWLRQRWADGAVCSLIARELGITKNAVVGKVRRLRLAPRASPLHAAGQPRPPARPRPVKPPRPPRPPKAVQAPPEPRPVPPPPPPPPEPVAPRGCGSAGRMGRSAASSRASWASPRMPWWARSAGSGWLRAPRRSTPQASRGLSRVSGR